MRLDYLSSGSPDCPLIRLYDFSPAEVARLCLEVRRLASQELPEIVVHEFPYVSSIDGCRLWLGRSDWDQGVVRIGAPADFQCNFTAETWDNTAGLIEALACDAMGHQWLAQAPGEVAMLMSASGTW